MSQLSDATAKIVGEDDSRHKYSEAILLDRKQWLFVQHRYNLTAREREIAELICQGLRNGNIAKHLCIRPGTVKTHTRNIYRKVRVKSKIAMLLRFVNDAKETCTEYQETPCMAIAD